MPEKNAVVAVFNTHHKAESAVRELQNGGFDMTKLSIIGREYHSDQNIVGYYNAGNRIKSWGKRGAFWGGLWGLLVGAAFFVVPGVGPVLIAGPVAAWVVGALEGSVVVGSVSAIGAGLCSFGIPRTSVLKYDSAVKADKVLLVAHGGLDDVIQATRILQSTEAAELEPHLDSARDTQSAA